MIIDRIELYHVKMPLIYPWRTAYGEDAAIESVLCRMTSGTLEGWGESSPLAAPCYSPEWAGGVFQTVRDWLAPALLAQEVSSGAQLQQRLALFKGNPFAKAVLDTAWWNLEANRQGCSLAALLGGTRDAVSVGADFGVMDDVQELLEPLGRAVADGFPRIKLKFRPGWDLPMLETVRQAFPDHPIHIDCNSGYRLKDLPLFQQVDQYHLEMIEQPLAHTDLIDHAELQQKIDTPVCLDESIHSLELAEQAVRIGSCRYVNIKPGRVGGLTPAVAIHDHCRQAGIPCWVGGMLESATGAGICASLATLDNFTYPADLFPSSRFYHEDLADPPIELERTAEGPVIRAPQTLATPVAQRLANQTVQRATLTRQVSG